MPTSRYISVHEVRSRQATFPYEFVAQMDTVIGNYVLVNSSNRGAVTVMLLGDGRDTAPVEDDFGIVLFDCSDLVGKTLVGAELNLIVDNAATWTASQAQGFHLRRCEVITAEGTQAVGSGYTGQGPTYQYKNAATTTPWTNTGGGFSNAGDPGGVVLQANWSSRSIQIGSNNQFFPNAGYVMAIGDQLRLNDVDCVSGSTHESPTRAPGNLLSILQWSIDNRAGIVCLKFNEENAGANIRTKEFGNGEHAPVLFITTSEDI